MVNYVPFRSKSKQYASLLELNMNVNCFPFASFRVVKTTFLRHFLNIAKLQYPVVGLIILLLTSCGFHLRGMQDMPIWLDNIAIVIQNAHRDLEPRLAERLAGYHINVSTEPDLAKYWLIIESDAIQQRVTGISSSTTSRQYQLIYTVSFKLQAGRGKEIIPLTTVASTRQVTINNNRILGSNDEQATLQSEMRRDAAIQILARLASSHYAP